MNHMFFLTEDVDMGAQLIGSYNAGRGHNISNRCVFWRRCSD